MDYESARKYALNRLERDLPDNLYYHGLAHTRDVVVPATARLATDMKLSEKSRHLVLTAAWFHDIGFVKQYRDNEPIAAEIARNVLPDYGYKPDDIQIIHDLIMVTRIPQRPRSTMEKIMADADLDMLGREDFLVAAQQLRIEQAEWLGIQYSDLNWYRFEMQFLSNHRFFTYAQRAHRNRGKVKNFLQIVKLLSEERSVDLHRDALRTPVDETTPFRPI
jgi:uncharacterized protein